VVRAGSLTVSTVFTAIKEMGRYRRSAASGIAGSRNSYGLTAIAGDFDDDGWPDIYLACDSTPSLLFMNNHDGTFREEGAIAACVRRRRSGTGRNGRRRWRL